MGLDGGVEFDDVGLLLEEMSFIVDGVLRTQIVGGAFWDLYRRRHRCRREPPPLLGIEVWPRHEDGEGE